MNSNIINHNLSPIILNPNVQRLVEVFDLEIEEATIHNVKVPQDQLPSINSATQAMQPTSPLFSFFKKPISNSTPFKNIGIPEAFKAITSDYYKSQTQTAHRLFLEYLDTRNKKTYTDFKTVNFGYCTFSGTFTQRADSQLIQHSGLYCMDSDNILKARDLMHTLIHLKDPFFEVELCFRSMSGFGVKWIISLKNPQLDRDHANLYQGLQGYIKKTYGIETDKTHEVSRACFLSHDPHVYINPKYQI